MSDVDLEIQNTTFEFILLIEDFSEICRHIFKTIYFETIFYNKRDCFFPFSRPPLSCPTGCTRATFGCARPSFYNLDAFCFSFQDHSDNNALSSHYSPLTARRRQ